MSTEEEIILELVKKGALEVTGTDAETGEIIYKVTSKMKDINPLLFKEHQDHVHDETMFLWEQGFLNINVTEANPIVKLTPKAFNPDAIISLPLLKRLALEDIKAILLKK